MYVRVFVRALGPTGSRGFCLLHLHSCPAQACHLVLIQLPGNQACSL